jgi:hypothetical protein
MLTEAEVEVEAELLGRARRAAWNLTEGTRLAAA